MAVRNGRENSRPEKGRRKRKWVRFRRAGLLVCCLGCWDGAFVSSLGLVPDDSFSELPLEVAGAIFDNRGCVSGR